MRNKNLFPLLVGIIFFAFCFTVWADNEETYVWWDDQGQVQYSKTKPDWWKDSPYDQNTSVEPDRRSKLLRLIELNKEESKILGDFIPRLKKCKKLYNIQVEIDNLIEDIKDESLIAKNNNAKLSLQSFCHDYWEFRSWSW